MRNLERLERIPNRLRLDGRVTSCPRAIGSGGRGIRTGLTELAICTPRFYNTTSTNLYQPSLFTQCPLQSSAHRGPRAAGMLVVEVVD